MTIQLNWPIRTKQCGETREPLVLLQGGQRSGYVEDWVGGWGFKQLCHPVHICLWLTFMVNLLLLFHCLRCQSLIIKVWVLSSMTFSSVFISSQREPNINSPHCEVADRGKSVIRVSSISVHHSLKEKAQLWKVKFRILNMWSWEDPDQLWFLILWVIRFPDFSFIASL